MKFFTIDGLPFEDPAWIPRVDGEESISNNDESYSNKLDSDTVILSPSLTSNQMPMTRLIQSMTSARDVILNPSPSILKLSTKNPFQPW